MVSGLCAFGTISEALRRQGPTECIWSCIGSNWTPLVRLRPAFNWVKWQNIVPDRTGRISTKCDPKFPSNVEHFGIATGMCCKGCRARLVDQLVKDWVGVWVFMRCLQKTPLFRNVSHKNSKNNAVVSVEVLVSLCWNKTRECSLSGLTLILSV